MPEASAPVDILTVPCLSDNYAYLIHDRATGATAVVDVPETGPILAALEAEGWTLSDIWITHHHHDHIGGVDALKAETGARVTGASADAHRLPPLDVAVAEGDTIALGSLQANVLDVSGHTVGHIAYHIAEAPAVFTADSLMALGCGRLFEGSAAQMWASLSKLAALDPETLIYSGHEYTASNGAFALTIEPENPDLISRVRQVAALREKQQPTVPVTLAEELKTNPFLRATEPGIASHLGMQGADPVDVFADIRNRKDKF